MQIKGKYFFLYKEGKDSPRPEPFMFKRGWCGPLIYREAQIGQARTGASIVPSDITTDEILAAFGLVEPTPEAKAAILERMGVDCANCPTSQEEDSAAAELTADDSAEEDDPDSPDPEEEPVSDEGASGEADELGYHDKLAAVREGFDDDVLRERFGKLRLTGPQVDEAYAELNAD